MYFITIKNNKKRLVQAPMSHQCNPIYSGSRDQEDWSSRPAQAKSETLSQKYPTH
jgi:hypothetical protein